MRLKKAWTTHIPMLIKYVQLADKPVLELGSGIFSTPLLHWLCKMQGVELFTYENVDEYYKFAKQFQSRNHRIRFVEDWNKVIYPYNKYGVVFIDHAPAERRQIEAITFANLTDYVILHDADESIYGYNKVYPHFKYIYKWEECKPYTTVLSNFNEL